MIENKRPNELRSILIRTMVLACVGNSEFANIHVGSTRVTKTGDYSDVIGIDVVCKPLR